MIESMLSVFDVLILTVEGQLVLQQQLIGSTSGLDLNGLDAGTYIVKVFSEGDLKSLRHIVKLEK